MSYIYKAEQTSKQMFTCQKESSHRRETPSHSTQGAPCPPQGMSSWNAVSDQLSSVIVSVLVFAFSGHSLMPTCNAPGQCDAL